MGPLSLNHLFKGVRHIIPVSFLLSVFPFNSLTFRKIPESHVGLTLLNYHLLSKAQSAT